MAIYILPSYKAIYKYSSRGRPPHFPMAAHETLQHKPQSGKEHNHAVEKHRRVRNWSSPEHTNSIKAFFRSTVPNKYSAPCGNLETQKPGAWQAV
ncbi:hypothetical protein HYFRA_00007718 [Hymenoscyphus fraxineus]|uniref:Uncharacterized protein n=1 Tax=Hymenoscyphus fraxineus TaxID=746836 RepID=A0A9N9KM23_9HELO|nr:hypothetical protein HYFRA_00007718 [Hymenoscyphus fraxineus]